MNILLGIAFFCLLIIGKASTNDDCLPPYDAKYPLTSPSKVGNSIAYKIGIVGDFDKDSKVPGENYEWYSIYKKGFLKVDPKDNASSVVWDADETRLTTHYSWKGRGAELSELVTFDKRILSFCDKTGVVFQIEDETLYPWSILPMGTGKNMMGMKAEWATVKDKTLYVGSTGVEWISEDGKIISTDPMWIYTISPLGEKKHIDWTKYYNELRKAIGDEFPGYVVHESVMWSEFLKKWFFLPRKCSKEIFEEVADESRTCDVLFSADEHFNTVTVTTIPGLNLIRGFSSFKFLPGSDDYIIVALKSKEYRGETATYLTVFTIDGKIILSDQKVADKKYEGIEFI